MTRGANLTAAQLAKLMKQAPSKLDRALRATTKETDIETALVDAMVLDGWRPFKMEENFSERKMKRTGEPGMCDRLFVRYHKDSRRWGGDDPGRSHVELLWWEFKRIIVRPGRKPKASQLDPDQVKWIDAERHRGALVWVAGINHPATIEGCAKYYLESGLCRRTELFLKLLPIEERMR